MMAGQKKPSIEEKMKALAVDLYGTDDLSQFAAGHLEWLEKEAEKD